MVTDLKRVLLVDDDHGLLRLLSMRLQSAGYDVACATSGEEAMSRLPVFRPGVMITDLRMGGMDGMALFKAVHKRAPTLPVIMLTAHGTIPDAVSATAQGVFSFLTKPFDAKELLQRLDDAFKASGGAAVSANEENVDDWHSEIITRSALMDEVLSQARLIAENNVSVFIHGQSGSGKELLARAIHRASPRRDKPFVALNCSAIPEQLLESELFGHKKGAFTGATTDYKGLFRAADGGTLFLDEIGDMPVAFQAKLLRALQERTVRPVGSTESVPVDVRIISATHRDLEEAVEEKEFREDLYFRLNVVSLDLPPLSRRREDIPLLANHFLDQLCQAERHKNKKFSNDALELLVAAPWPGNVRQLYNVVEQVVVLSTTPLIPASLVQRALRNQPKEMLSFADARNQFEREYLAQVLKMTNGNVTQAARIAGRNRTEFYKLLNKHEIIPSIFKSQS